MDIPLLYLVYLWFLLVGTDDKTFESYSWEWLGMEKHAVHVVSDRGMSRCSTYHINSKKNHKLEG
jgi:hypothetical protein